MSTVTYFAANSEYLLLIFRCCIIFRSNVQSFTDRSFKCLYVLNKYC